MTTTSNPARPGANTRLAADTLPLARRITLAAAGAVVVSGTLLALYGHSSPVTVSDASGAGSGIVAVISCGSTTVQYPHGTHSPAVTAVPHKCVQAGSADGSISGPDGGGTDPTAGGIPDGGGDDGSGSGGGNYDDGSDNHHQAD